jgi:hypothetical protein
MDLDDPVSAGVWRVVVGLFLRWRTGERNRGEKMRSLFRALRGENACSTVTRNGFGDNLE